jgi:hypothetical protein
MMLSEGTRRLKLVLKGLGGLGIAMLAINLGPNDCCPFVVLAVALL